MESLEELTPERVKGLTQAEARALFDERNALIGHIRQELQMLAPKAFPPGKPMPVIDADAENADRIRVRLRDIKCPSCGSKDIMPQKGKRIFCRKCNMSSEVE